MVLWTAKILDVANFTTLLSLSLQSSYKISFLFLVWKYLPCLLPHWSNEKKISYLRGRWWMTRWLWPKCLCKELNKTEDLKMCLFMSFTFKETSDILQWRKTHNLLENCNLERGKALNSAPYMGQDGKNRWKNRDFLQLLFSYKIHKYAVLLRFDLPRKVYLFIFHKLPNLQLTPGTTNCNKIQPCEPCPWRLNCLVETLWILSSTFGTASFLMLCLTWTFWGLAPREMRSKWLL
jgi:hypothetical protein